MIQMNWPALTIVPIVFLGLASALPTQAQAQTRVFVAAQGSDSNPCTFALPCRTFQHAHDTVLANGEIDVLDPAGYGALTIGKSISIQGHGYSGITATSGTAITINAGPNDKVHLRGLVVEGFGTGLRGIDFQAGGSLDIVDCVARHFAGDGIILQPAGSNVSTTSKVSITNTLASDNGITGININNIGPFKTFIAFFNKVTTNNNAYGIHVNSQDLQSFARLMVVNSISSGNATYGIASQGIALDFLNLDRVSLFENGIAGLRTSNSNVEVVLGHSAVSDPIDCTAGGSIRSFGDNRISTSILGTCFVTVPTQ